MHKVRAADKPAVSRAKARKTPIRDKSKDPAQAKGLQLRQGHTREHILMIAMDEFSNKGYDGARVDAIAISAGISKNLIYHYFKSKDALFIEVMEHAYARMRGTQNDLFKENMAPDEAIENLTIYTFRHFQENPDLISLLNTENLHKAIHITSSATIQKMYVPLIDFLKKTIERGQQAGLFRDKVDPTQLYITISGLSYFYLSNRYTLSFVLNRDLMAARHRDQWEAHIVSVVLGYLRR